MSRAGSVASSQMNPKKRAAFQRLRSQPNSRLTKIQLANMLVKPGAWEILSEESRKQLYDLLPLPYPGQPAYNINRNPISTNIGVHLRRVCGRWQHDLGAGWHTKTHRAHKITTTWTDIPDRDPELAWLTDKLIASKHKKTKRST